MLINMVLILMLIHLAWKVVGRKLRLAHYGSKFIRRSRSWKRGSSRRGWTVRSYSEIPQNVFNRTSLRAASRIKRE